MHITHQEARHLIQHRADHALNSAKKEVLNAHLKACLECAEYANEMQETEATLRTVLRKQWNVHLLPVQVQVIKAKINPYYKLFDRLTTRSALVGMTVVFFFFVFWQSTSTHSGFQSGMTAGVPAIPTPSLLLTNTQNNFENCRMIYHNVRRDDTLANVAHAYSVSEQAITDLNDLEPAVGTLPATLIIPVCDVTPTGTTRPATSTTNTPALEFTTYTPG